MKERMTEIIKAKINGAEVTFNDVIKDNGVVSHGILIRENETVSTPCIYYDPDLITEENVEEATDAIISQYIARKNDLAFGGNEFVTRFMNVDYVKAHVFPYIVSYEENRDMIEEYGLAYRRVLDFAVLYRVEIDVLVNDAFGSFKIASNHLDVIGLSLEEIDEYAFRNAEHNICVMSMRDFLVDELKKSCEGFDPDNEEMLDALFGPKDDFITIYSNNKHRFGAVSMLVPNVFKERCYIIPSSVHEVIVVPADGENDVTMLKDMVKEVNVTQVSQKERLSYNIYYYNGKSLEIVA